MSKKNRDRKAAQTAAPTAPPPGPVSYTTTLKPHPRLLVILLVVFGIWVGLLLTMYFTTIYPIRHNRTLPSSVDNGGDPPSRGSINSGPQIPNRK